MSADIMEGGVWRPTKEYVHKSARDSLSPKSLYSFVRGHSDREVHSIVSLQQEDGVELQTKSEAHMQQGRHAEQHDPMPTSTSTERQPTDITTTPSSTMTKQTCVPRSSLARARRPFRLELDDSRGATSVSPAELRQWIRKTTSGSNALSLRAQVIQHTSLPSPLPYQGRKKYPRPGKLIGATVLVRQPSAFPANPSDLQRPRYQPMGNQQSHHASTHGRPHMLAATSLSSIEDESSLESIVHPRLRNKVPTKSGSSSVLKKKFLDAKAETAVNFTTTIIEVPRAATAPNLDLLEENEERDWVEEKENILIRHAKTLSAPSPALLSYPGSPATITEESAARPLSAGTTITGVSFRSDEGQDIDNASSSPHHLRVSALSPIIPTPSPLSEDSPHQYGLKDFADTPSPPPDPRKAKRHSNGLDIFNGAKSLQAVSSFLNGLSNARRRAESRPRSTRSTTKSHLTSASTANLPYNNGSATLQTTPAHKSLSHLPLSEPSSRSSTESRPLTPKLDDLARTLGHTHKSSGFAYAKPLSIVQLKCYRKHDRLLRSGNKLYQVECAVCHKDEPGDFYWSCSWCALRMCDVCRTTYRKNGMKALKEEIRIAEFGAQS